MRDASKFDDRPTESEIGRPLARSLQLPLLPVEQERKLATSIWDGRRRLARLLRPANEALSSCNGDETSDGPLTRSERNALIDAELRARALVSGRAAHGLEAARMSAEVGREVEATLQDVASSRETLLAHNLRLVVWAASSYRGKGLDFADVIQEGAIGLLYAIDRFDPAVGTRLSSFATVVIRNQMTRALGEKSRLIRAPIKHIRDVSELEAARAELLGMLGRTPTVAEIATMARMDANVAENLLPGAAPPLSLETTPVSEGIALRDVLEDEHTASPFALARERERSRAVLELVARLGSRSATILSMRFGFDGARECTLEEIGQRFGVSRERIRQLEGEALASLKEMILAEKPELMTA